MERSNKKVIRGAGLRSLAASGRNSPSLFFPGMGSKAPRTSSEDGQRVHQLWPPEDVVRSTNFDVVFFMAYKGKVKQILGRARGCSVLTPTIVGLKIGSHETWVKIDTWRLGQRGFVMIGHCFGGLVIKSLMEEAQMRSQSRPENKWDRKVVASAEKFLRNLKGIMFYAVPHLGSELKSYFTQFNSTQFANGVKWAGILQNLRSHQSRMADLSQTCDGIISQFSINVFAFLEGTTIPNMKCKLVEKPGA